MSDRNDMAYWFPPIWAEGLPVPETRIVETDVDLAYLLDGVKPEGYDDFIGELGDHVQEVGGGGPVFLRTGHTSGKHNWLNTCWLQRAGDLQLHVAMLVEESLSVDVVGLPLGTWAVRAPISTKPAFRCDGYRGFPVVREFRAFVGAEGVYHLQPYWPADAVEQGRPDRPDWRERLRAISRLFPAERQHLVELAEHARGSVEAHHGDHGEWSVDLLQDRDGLWWLTDMADAERSFMYGESL